MSEQKTGITVEPEINGGSQWQVVDWDAYAGGKILGWFREKYHAEIFHSAMTGWSFGGIGVVLDEKEPGIDASFNDGSSK